MFKGYVTANLVNTTQNKLNSKHEYFDTKHAMSLNDEYQRTTQKFGKFHTKQVELQKLKIKI